jgi:hypothetical protein
MVAAAKAGYLPRTDGQLARRPQQTFLLQIPLPYPENHDHQTSP